MTIKLSPEQKGLRFAAAVTVAFGLWTALSAIAPLSPPFRFLASLLFWPPQAGPAAMAGETGLGFAIAGGVLAGWGAMIWQLAGAPFDQAPDPIRRIITGSVLIWFAVDSTASALTGAVFNVPANMVFLGLFLWPMRRVARVQPA